MTTYIFRRLLLLLPTLFGLSVIAFSVVHIVPGDPVEVMLSDRASPESILKLQQELGLDQPIPVQYAKWLGHVLKGDLGNSIITGQPIISEFARRMPATIELASLAILVAVLIGIPLGTIAASRKGSLLDYGSWTFALIGVSMPLFWLELLLIWIFAVALHWLPVSGRVPFDLTFDFKTQFYLFESVLRGRFDVATLVVRHMVLPALAMATWPIAVLTRMTRSAMLEVLSQNYIRTARSKGLPERVVLFKHALRNALLGVLTMVGLALGSLLSGGVVTESVFAWPGIGQMMLQSIGSRDYPQLQGLILLIAVMVVLINLAVDLLYGRVDPRIRYE